MIIIFVEDTLQRGNCTDGSMTLLCGAKFQMDTEDEAQEDTGTIAMAMALLVIESTHLRDTISGLTDHNLL